MHTAEAGAVLCVRIICLTRRRFYATLGLMVKEQQQEFFLSRLVLVVAGIIALVVAGGYLLTIRYNKPFSLSPSIPSTTIPTSIFVSLKPTMPPSTYTVIDDPTRSGWKLYTNQTYKFSFSYPANKLTHFTVLNSDGYSAGIRLSSVPVSPGGYPETDGIVFDIKATTAITTSIDFFNTEQSQKYFYDKKFVTVDGEKGVIYNLLHKPQPQNDSSNVYYLAETIHNGIQYSFSMNALSVNMLISNEPLLEQIFSTIKFL